MPAPEFSPTRSALTSSVIAATVALVEATGPLDDEAELRQAHRTESARASQFMLRAWLLGERLGLPAEFTRWRRTGAVVVIGLAVLMALSALGMARAVVGEARSINAVAAFVTLLGMHFVTLLLWLLGVLWPRALAGLSLGKLALWLSARFSLDRGPHSLTILRAFERLLRQYKLLPWAFGMISHAIWALAFALILVVLMFGFAFHAYRLSWETTILSSSFFQQFVSVTGWLPSMLGFAVPDADTVQRAGSGAAQVWSETASQRNWAWWLMGCVFAYGLLPRILLALFSYARWHRGVIKMGVPDSSDPYVRTVYARLDALDPPVVSDPERRITSRSQVETVSMGPAMPDTVAVIGFELPPEFPWPVPDLPILAGGLEGREVLSQRIAGTSAERRSIIEAVSLARAWQLLIVCNSASSPDRGTARFLRELLPLARECQLLLVFMSGAGDILAAQEGQVHRWQEWLLSERLDTIKVVASAAGSGSLMPDRHPSPL